MTAAMTHYVIHHSDAGYGVRAVGEDLIVWQAHDASAGSAAYLTNFLNGHAREVPAHRVRALLVELGSDLRSVPPTSRYAVPDDGPAERAS